MSAVYPTGVSVNRHARISADGIYRYALWRDWRDWRVNEAPRWATFIMLNPSTADAELDDPTIRRCVGFARTMGATGLVVVNLYAYRASRPADLWRADDPVGPEGDATLAEFLAMAAKYRGPVIAAWGASVKHDRTTRVLDLAHSAGVTLTALGVTKAGAPRHPLYLRSDATPTPWGGAK